MLLDQQRLCSREAATPYRYAPQRNPVVDPHGRGSTRPCPGVQDQLGAHDPQRHPMMRPASMPKAEFTLPPSRIRPQEGPLWGAVPLVASRVRLRLCSPDSGCCATASQPGGRTTRAPAAVSKPRSTQRERPHMCGRRRVHPRGRRGRSGGAGGTLQPGGAEYELSTSVVG